MKNLNKILVVIMVVIIGLTMFSVSVEAASIGPATCSVSPGSVIIPQGAQLGFTATSNHPSTAGDYVYVSAQEFSSGVSSDLGVGKVIPVGSTSIDFKIYTASNAKTGSHTFKVYCATSCPVSGCPGGGSPEILGYTTVSVNVSGTDVSGPGTGAGFDSDSCKVGSLILPPNSSDRVRIGFDSGEGNLSFSATPIDSGISGVSAYPNVRIGRNQNGSGREDPVVNVRTSSSFAGQSSYSLSCNYSGDKFTTTGVIFSPTVSNPGGRVNFTQMKDIKEILFPSSECPFNIKGCRSGFTDAPILVMSGSTPPALVGADMIALNTAPGLGNTSHPRLYNLTDPMNPVNSGLTGQIRAGGDYDTAGDFGPYLAIIGLAYSKDKKIFAGNSSQGVLYVWKDGKRYEDWDVQRSQVYGIIKYGFSYILVTDGGSYDISNGMTHVDSGIDTLSGNTWKRDQLNPAPSGFPRMETGSKIIFGDEKHILMVKNSIDKYSDPDGKREIVVYSADKPDIVARYDLPPYLGGPLAGGFNAHSTERWGTIPVSGGEYIYFLRSPAVGSAMDPKMYGPQKLTLYKFDYLTNKITEVVKEVLLSSGYITANTAFGANTLNPGIVVSSYRYINIAANERETKFQVYLISDLIQGKGEDTLVNSPIWKDNTHYTRSIASFSIGNTTYVYSEDARVYKLELGAVGGATVSPATPPGSGVIPVYPTPPTTGVDPNCPNGTVYQTSAGKLCVTTSGGVTTTTEYNFNATPVQGCSVGNIYNSLTGEKCNKNIEFMGPPIYNFGTTTLRNGSTGEAVKELQRFLNAKLNLGLVIDGKLGLKTVAVIKQWQKKNGLVSDGLVGVKTKALMNSMVN